MLILMDLLAKQHLPEPPFLLPTAGPPQCPPHRWAGHRSFLSTWPFLTANVCKLSLLWSDDVINPQVGLTFSCRSEGIEGIRGVRQRENRLLCLLGHQGGGGLGGSNSLIQQKQRRLMACMSPLQFLGPHISSSRPPQCPAFHTGSWSSVNVMDFTSWQPTGFRAWLLATSVPRLHEMQILLASSQKVPCSLPWPWPGTVECGLLVLSQKAVLGG